MYSILTLINPVFFGFFLRVEWSMNASMSTKEQFEQISLSSKPVHTPRIVKLIVLYIPHDWSHSHVADHSPK